MWLLTILSIIVILVVAKVIATPKRSQPSYQDLSVTPMLTTTPPPSTDERFTPITPTLLPSSQQGWVTFVYPDPSKKYTFEYPSTSNLYLDKDRYSDWIKVDLGEIGNYPSCRINFSGEANDAPWPGTITNQELIYGGRKVKAETIYKDNVPYTEFISFEGAAKDPFSFMQAYFPSTNTAKCQQLVDQILSSLKFYY